MASDKLNPVVGATATFIGYADLDEGMVEMLTKGQRVTITGGDAKAGWAVCAINEAGEMLNDEGGIWEKGQATRGDSLFDVELDDVTLPASAEEGSEIAVPKADLLTKENVAKMASKKLDEAVSANGIETPDGFGKFKVSDKRDHVLAWLDAQEEVAPAEATIADPLEAEGAPSVNTEAADPVEGEGTIPAISVADNNMPVMTDSQSVQTALAETDAISAAKALVVSESRTKFTLGGVLKSINETGAFKTLGYDGKKGFEDFCEKELGYGHRKAQYLISTYTKFRMIGVDEVELDKIGWSKSLVLARIASDKLSDDITALLEKANTTTRDDLITYVTENYEVATRNVPKVKTTTFSFKVVESEAETVKAAIDHAKVVGPSDDHENANAALLYMCGDWMNNSEGTDMDLTQFIQLGVSRFGADAIRSALDADTTVEEEGAEAANLADAISA